MNPDAPDKKQIFSEASQILGQEARAAFLAQACGDNVQLRQEIEELLQYETGGGDSLDIPAFDRGGILVGEKVGGWIGPYKLLQWLGEGGCGVVYMAEQEKPVRRRVALKIIKLGMDTKQVIARFEAERQALALMDHPNIATILDAGTTETGRPYFVMELVRGTRITDYCDQHNLSTQDRLKLFIQVCHAIQHAHQKGIVHRDIKPLNVLVTLHDGVPVPKVIDFGIAKATTDVPLTDKTYFTALHQFIGTLAYMSPEQCEMSGLNIDTRSDIYSLGVLLYELLAGSPPFDPHELGKAAREAMLKTIREVDPPSPSKRLRTLTHGDLTTVASRRQTAAAKFVNALRGDLDCIVMKALEKDRTRRYETANGFADDVQRYLSNEPVTATPPGRFYRFRKLVRRNKLLFVALGAVSTVLLIGLVSSTWLFFKEKKARAHASQRQLLAESQLVRLTDRSAGWSQRAWTLARDAARIPANDDDRTARDEAAATLARVDAQRIQQFTNFGGSSVLFARDGRRLLVGSLGDGTRLWDGTASAPLVVKNPDPSPVAFAGGQTPAHLLYDTNRQAFILSNLIGAEPLHEWAIPSGLLPKAGTVPTITALSPDGAVVVASVKLSNENEAVIAFRSNSASIIRESTASISSLAVSTDGRLAAVADSAGQLELWSLESGQRISQFATGRNEVLSLALKSFARTRAAGRQDETNNSVWLLAAGDSGGNVTIYDVESNDILAHCRGGLYQVYALAFSPDGATLASGGRGPVKLWDVATGTLLLNIHTGDYITGLDFAPDGLRLAVSTAGITYPRNVSIWNLQYGRGIQSLRGLSGQISKICFSADGRRIAALSHQWDVGVWDVASGQLLRVIGAPPGRFADNAAIALNSSGEQLAFSSRTNARLWNVESGQVTITCDLPEGLADILAFTDRNRPLLFREETLDGKTGPLSDAHPKQHPRICRVRDLLNPEPAKPAFEIRDFNWHVFNAATPLDGRCFVVEGIQADETSRRVLVKAFDSITGKELWSIPSSRNNGSGLLVADAAGKFIAFQTNNSATAILAQLTSGSITRQLPRLPCAISPPTGVSVAPGNPQDEDRGCSLYLNQRETPTVTLGIDGPPIYLATFDSTGNLLAWGNTDGTVTICNLKEINKRLAEAGLQW